MRRYKEFYKVVKFLKETLPLHCPVIIRRAALDEINDGECVFLKNRFIIKIQKSLPEYYATEVLLHELAHVISWDKDKDDHGKQWGIAYSKVYREYLKYLSET